jgi:hypothetical protein
VLDLVHVGLDRNERVVVVFAARHVEQLAAVGQLGVDLDQPVDDILQRFLLTAELLRPGRVVPDVRGLELAVQDVEPVLLPVEVKDTSGVPRPARAGRRSGNRSDSGVRLPWRDPFCNS